MKARRSLIVVVSGALAGVVAVTAADARVNAFPSPSFAGYAVQAPGLNKVQAEFVIPKLACSTSLSGVGPGVFAVSKPTKHAAGKLTGAGMIAACQNGQEVYQIARVVNGVETNTPVSQGDLISVYLSQTSKKTIVGITDVTNPANSRTQRGGGNSVAYVDVGTAAVVFNNTIGGGIDPFHPPIAFTKVRINHKPLAAWNPLAEERVRQVGSHRIVQIVPSAIAHNGMAFTLSFVHS